MLISLLKMIKFNKNLEGNKQSDQENGVSCAKLSMPDRKAQMLCPLSTKP
jgi:hypothetical protein